jgi:YfiH family protein
MLVLRSARLTEAGFEHAFALREAADADLRRALSVDVIVQVKQVHGARAVAADDLPLAEADAIVARGGRHVAVGVRVADCVPLLVGDEDSGDVAAIHAGWRGIVAGVVRAGVELLGGRNLVAAIGPCIGPCCFEVGLDVAEEIARASDAEHGALSQRGGKAYADLRSAVRAQLRALGVADDRIEDVPGCTKHDAVRFHSFRRDGRESGRMLSAIATAGRRLSPS